MKQEIHPIIQNAALIEKRRRLRLTTELRVLALIRLGISDNQAIADILRSSITTIYTYRSRLKSRAIAKDSFEDDIKKIATY